MTLVSSNISKAIEILNNEDLVAIPTETVYGLAGNIFSETAIQKIFTTKKRPKFNPLIVHLHSANQLKEIISYIPEKALLLSQTFWPGPLTLVLPKKNIIPDLVTAGKDTVAIRIPNHRLTLDLLKNLDFPLAAPSANPFGSISPTTAEHVKNYFDGQLKMVLDGGACEAGIESTIVGFDNEDPVIYRLGSTSIEDIEKVVGKVKVQNRSESQPVAPGMLSRHYAPSTPTFLVDDASLFAKQFPKDIIGVLSLHPVEASSNIAHQETLSLDGDLQEATSNLYAALHRLDTKDLDKIICQKFPNEGLGVSINDRLQRATK